MYKVLWFIPNYTADRVTGGEVYNSMFFNSISSSASQSKVFGFKRSRLNLFKELLFVFRFFKDLISLRFNSKGRVFILIDSKTAVMSCSLMLVARYIFRAKILVTCHHLMEFDNSEGKSLSKNVRVFYEKYLFLLANTIITVSKATQANIGERYYDKIELITPPIKYKGINEAVNCDNGELMSLVVVGSLTNPRKLHHVCINAFGLLKSKSIKLNFVGAYEESNCYYKELQQIVGELGLGDSVTFSGRVSDEQLINYIRNSSLMLMPGIEGYGMAAAEAVCLGVPVVGNLAGGISEVIEHEVNGYLIEDMNEKTLSQAIELILGNKAFYESLVSGCYSATQSYLSNDEFIDKCKLVIHA